MSNYRIEILDIDSPHMDDVLSLVITGFDFQERKRKCHIVMHRF